DRTMPTVSVEVTLDEAAEAIVEAPARSIAALDDQGRVTGILDLGVILRAYQKVLETNYRHFARVASGATLLEERVDTSSRLAGRKIADAGFPLSTLVVTIRRGDQLVFPHGDTVFEVDDFASILVDEADVQAVDVAIRGSARQEQESTEETPPMI
ncbi:MAG: TrkA C-terminal domain-containing protein, partial [Actinomycetota bacterium]